MTEPHLSDFAWFATWANQRLGACLTFGRGLSWDDMLDAFGLSPDDVSSEGQGQTHRPRVQVASNGQWGWAIEQFTAKGSEPETLCRISARGSDALSLTLTQTVNSLLYAAGGTLVAGFDLTAPHIRYGTDPERLLDAMRRSGFLDGPISDPAAMGAYFLQVAFGLELRPEMVEGDLRSAELP